jgi:hypothetical protein
MYIQKFRNALVGLAIACSAAFGGNAIAQTINVYTWDGLCSDCSPLGDTPATATLTLQDYTAGTALTDANFISFTYTSAIFPTGLSFVADANATISGILPADGDGALSLAGLTDLGSGLGLYSFTTLGTGAWTLALNGTSFDEHREQGEHSSRFRHHEDEHCDHRCSPSPIPEPESYAMMLAGLGLMGFIARRRKQKTA